MKKIVLSSIIIGLMLVTNVSLKAGGSNRDIAKIGSCAQGNLIVNATPSVQPGTGGQDFVSEVRFEFHNRWATDPSRYGYTNTIQIYDWNGNQVQEVSIETGSGYATGLVDGTYIFTFTNDIGDSNTGQFNVNHNIDNQVYVEMGDYLCGYDTKLDYVQNNRNDDPIANSSASCNSNVYSNEEEKIKQITNSLIEFLNITSDIFS